MAFENLTDREKQVLANLIDHYITTADPVGSRLIANKFRMGISPATVRNTLQDLEELGLVEQPHTSAGRVPTDQGYRLYVDLLFRPADLTEAEKAQIRGSLLKEGRGIDAILGQTARVLGEITNQLGMTLAPRFESGVLRGLRLIPVASGKIMVVVIVESGLARSLVLEVESSVGDAVLSDIEALLNERLAGLSLREIRATISERLADVGGEARLINFVVDAKDKIWADDNQDTLTTAGVNNLIATPEFSVPEKMVPMLRLLEERKALTEFLAAAEDEGLLITIGKESAIDEIMNCSLVTSTYRVGKISGKIGIIGPTRMPYSKLVSIVEYTARSITEVLSGYNEKTREVS